jgi:hypothetical protein
LLRLEYADEIDSSPGTKNIDLFPGACIILFSSHAGF